MDKIRELVLQAVGSASMCWEKIDEAGIFKSEQAIEVGDKLATALKKEFIKELEGLKMSKFTKNPYDKASHEKIEQNNRWVSNFNNRINDLIKKVADRADSANIMHTQFIQALNKPCDDKLRELGYVHEDKVFATCEQIEKSGYVKLADVRVDREGLSKILLDNKINYPSTLLDALADQKERWLK